MAVEEKRRGRFDRATGPDAMGAPRPREGHPLPRSGEARHNEIPEHLVREKGRGDDPKGVVQPAGEPVTPEGEPYRYDDLGRGPHAVDPDDELRRDQAAHQDRGQSAAEAESRGR